MNNFLFFNIVISFKYFFNCLCLLIKFFQGNGEKVNQDTLVGLALIFLTMFTGFFGYFILF